MEEDSASPVPSGGRCAAACRDVPLADLASLRASSPSLAGEDADWLSGADSASTCASSDWDGSEHHEESLPAGLEDGAGEDDEVDALGDAADEVGEREEEVDRQLLVRALGQVLDHLSTLGRWTDRRRTVFHAAHPPALDIPTYLQRIDSYYHCSDQCLVLGLVYIDRIANLHPNEFVVSPLNVHRLVAVATMLAAKYWDDVFYGNDHYARVAGLRLSELNALEAQFLKLLHWRLFVEPTTYGFYFAQILHAAGRRPLAPATTASSITPAMRAPEEVPEPWPS